METNASKSDAEGEAAYLCQLAEKKTMASSKRALCGQVT
jgi:hypothetical protein